MCLEECLFDTQGNHSELKFDTDQVNLTHIVLVGLANTMHTCVKCMYGASSRKPPYIPSCTVHLAENHHTYRHVRCMYTVLANLTYMLCFALPVERRATVDLATVLD